MQVGNVESEARVMFCDDVDEIEPDFGIAGE